MQGRTVQGAPPLTITLCVRGNRQEIEKKTIVFRLMSFLNNFNVLSHKFCYWHEEDTARNRYISSSFNLNELRAARNLPLLFQAIVKLKFHVLQQCCSSSCNQLRSNHVLYSSTAIQMEYIYTYIHIYTLG